MSANILFWIKIILILHFETLFLNIWIVRQSVSACIENIYQPPNIRIKLLLLYLTFSSMVFSCPSKSLALKNHLTPRFSGLQSLCGHKLTFTSGKLFWNAKTYVARGPRMSFPCREKCKAWIPVWRSPSKPKKWITLSNFGGNNETAKWKRP